MPLVTLAQANIAKTLLTGSGSWLPEPDKEMLIGAVAAHLENIDVSQEAYEAFIERGRVLKAVADHVPA